MLVFMAVLMMSSCVSTKKIVYFQDPQEVFRQGQQLMQQYEMRLKPADQVLIKVTCSEPELLTIFAQDVMMGTAGTNSSQNITNNNGSMTNAYGYTVSNEGIITLPAVGQVSVAGLTTDEAARRIEQSIINAKLIKDPEVTVRLLNARVAVLGAVHAPAVDLVHDVLLRDAFEADLAKELGRVGEHDDLDGSELRNAFDHGFHELAAESAPAP